MEVYSALALAGVLALAWCLTLLGMPGNWLMVLAAIFYKLLMPPDSAVAIGWPVVGVLFAFAVLGEVIEFVAGAVGTARVGGGRRSAALAILGSAIGGVAGIFIGLPIPVVGSVVAAVLFAAVGAFLGAVLGEFWRGRRLEESWRVGKAAFWGRLWGTLAKTMIATVMVLLTVTALLVR